MKGMKRKCRKKCLSKWLAVCCAAILLTGCAGVEPEKRSYPLAISIDYEKGEYEVIYGMADLPADTGQGKDSQAEGTEPYTGVALRGKNLQEIQTLYDASQQYDLDLGHVQAVILGKGLLEAETAAADVFRYMEEDAVLGKSVFLFQTDDPGAVMELNGTSVESLGDYLTGIYENRTDSSAGKPLTLEDFFYVWNNYGKIAEIPRILMWEGQILLEK